MCEIFGFSSCRKSNLKPYLTEFFSHSVHHPNGWGLAEFGDEGVRVQIEPVSARESKILPELVANLQDSKTLLAHIRRATVGGVKSENCHPFVRTDDSGRTWTLIHNGTVFSGMELIYYQNQQTGDTDSERILLYLIDKMNDEIAKKGCALNSFERFKVVEKVVANITYRNKINLLIYDGSQMYVHVNMKDTLYFKTDEFGTAFATTPLEPEGWQPLPLTTLLVYREGKLQYKGKNHHNEYIDVIGTSAQQYDYNI